jgi:hypothetical protein
MYCLKIIFLTTKYKYQSTRYSQISYAIKKDIVNFSSRKKKSYTKLHNVDFDVDFKQVANNLYG